jgi:N-acetyl-gamma-glutamyl-phosphate reductase
MVNVAVIGAAGYTGQTLLASLLRHPDVRIAAVTSDTYLGQPLAVAFPQFATARTPLVFEGNNHEAIADRVDAVFLCLPHKEGMPVTALYRGKGKVVFDLSADFRLNDPAVYERWYGVPHTEKELLETAVYGLPELYKGRLTDADLVAVPGCYPTASLLALAPVMGSPFVDPTTLIVSAASGVSGAGRKSDLIYNLAEMEGNYFAYAAPHHRHTPEIEQELSKLAGAELRVTFVPHLLPTERGIYATVYAKLTEAVDEDGLRERYRRFYADTRFVTVVEGYPRLKWASRTNGVFIGVAVDHRANTLVVTAAIDNLIKGAAGQAVQCFNLRYGFAEEVGL